MAAALMAVSSPGSRGRPRAVPAQDPVGSLSGSGSPTPAPFHTTSSAKCPTYYPYAAVWQVAQWVDLGRARWHLMPALEGHARWSRPPDPTRPLASTR
jgi:hypothetical protein